MKTFEQFLTATPCIDYIMRVSKNAQGMTQFYIHPYNESGETWDFVVEGNHLTRVGYDAGNVSYGKVKADLDTEEIGQYMRQRYGLTHKGNPSVLKQLHEEK